MPLDSVKNTATPQQQNTDKADKMALAGGILAIAGWFVPYIGIIAVPIGVALCIVALKRGTKRKKFVKRVLIFTGVMLLFTIYVLAVFIDW